MRKKAALFILVVMLAEVLNFRVFALSDDKAAESAALKTLEAFGILSGGTRAEDMVFKKDFARILYNLMNLEETGKEPPSSKQVYKDVERFSECAGYIEYIYDYGIYAGDGDGYFRPDENVKSDVLTGALLNISGYSEYMKYSGSGLTEMQQAANLKILKGNQTVPGHALTFGELSEIIVNFFDVNVMKAAASLEGVSYEQGGKVLEEILDLSCGYGVVTGVNMLSFTYENCADGEIIINGRKFLYKGGEDILGNRIKYYYRDNKIFAAVSWKNEEKTLYWDKIIRYSQGRYFYESESGKEKSCPVDKGIKLLYNGKISEGKSSFVPEYGTVKLIDNDDDGSYDAAIVWDCETVFIKKIENNQIFSENKSVIDLEKYDKVSLLKNGEEITAANAETELKSGVVGSVAESADKKYIKIFISDKYEESVINSIKESGEIITESGSRKAALGCYDPDKLLNAGQPVKIYFDFLGNIAAVFKSGESGYKYGYVIKKAETDGIDKSIVLKILTEDGAVEELKCENKIIADGGMKKTPEEIFAAVTVDEIIRYTVAGKRIKKIDTPCRQNNFTDYFFEGYDNSLRCIADGKMQYKSAPRMFKRNSSMNLDGEFAVDEKTKIFWIPIFSGSDYKDYYVTDYKALQNDFIKNVKGYTAGGENITGSAVAFYYDNSSILVSGGIMVVDEKINVLNDEKKSSAALCGMADGNKKEYKISGACADSYDGIDKKSVIRYSLNKFNEITAIQNLYSADGSGKTNGASHEYSNTNSYDANIRAVYGYIYEKSNGNVIFGFKDDVSQKEVFCIGTGRIYVFESGKNQRLRLGSEEDIYSFKDYGAGCDEVVIFTRACNVTDVVVLKK